MRQLSQSTASIVYNGLRQKIIDLTLKPGALLVEQKLAHEYGVSRTPVREVLVWLASEGLVEILRNRGAMVAPIRVDAVRTAQFVRESLEVSVALTAAKNMNALARLKLSHAIEEQELANAEGNAELFYQADEAMHLEIAQIAGLPLVWGYIEEAKVQMDRVRRLSLSQAQSFDKLIAQHRRIVSAIAANDPVEITDSLNAHLRQVLPDIDALRRNRPEYFDEDAQDRPVSSTLHGQTVAGLA
ncbi:GntR family transcriptional regulator [Pseudooctadecabacter jejudonensis]|uniref:Putative HTH-type transcriptional regulator YdfH n=1 Tax=Pseudooctadecabacter jejudonensis TaxID=1391910 RepID=A0A1Y5TFI4_9RHOB|nr:GntR family transcriptional regulator [Pseudooctadecabacter jejudonensis]SLN62708.1 putative HTH-type transcriptional regulator YdfH [Pseudooctadecabacter jejudonensis]